MEKSALGCCQWKAIGFVATAIINFDPVGDLDVAPSNRMEYNYQGQICKGEIRGEAGSECWDCHNFYIPKSTAYPKGSGDKKTLKDLVWKVSKGINGEQVHEG